MNDKERRCPKHPDRKASMPTLKGYVCSECFFEQREGKAKGQVHVVTQEARP